MTMAISEVPVTFGPDGHLVGTLTLPTAPTAPVLVLLCNAGVIHRIGPHRINVKLARRLAAQGYAVFRFDLSGQGDSSTAASAVPFEQQAVADIRAAMDHATRVTGIDRFAMAGICSGAHHGMAAALTDPRLVALWMLDGYTYPTRGTVLVRVRRQLRLQFFGTLLGWALRPLGLLSRGLRRLQNDGPMLVDGDYPTPPKPQFARMMQTLADRGVAMRLVYSGSQFWRYNYADQLRDGFRGERFLDAVRCDYMPDVDHTVTSMQAQQQVTASITDWLKGLRRDGVRAAAAA